ncbi:MAG: RimK family alpha-L-glutamate ligase [Pasteurellaceae bacterium]|nr:RimK family alpha-L-glutamate ligase [Pasteurellaceae bacterium]
MKFLMLCREPRLYSCQRLLAAATVKGHQMDILDPNRCVLKLVDDAPYFRLFYQANLESEPVALENYDAIIPRFGTTSTKMGCAVLRHFHGLDVPCLNEEQAFLQTRDKWKSLQILRQAGIPIPNTSLIGNEVQLSTIISDLPEQTILKTLNGSQGIGVMLSEKPTSTLSIMETLRQAQVPFLVQDFVQEAQGADIRCFVIGQRVVATMQRIGRQGEFRANCHRGGMAQPIELSEQEKQIAVKATQVLGLDVSGVDLIQSATGLLVLEVNASPGLEMIEKTSAIDIAVQMIAFLENKVSAMQCNH